MKEYYLYASVDAIDIDFSITIYAKYPPSYWRCYEIANRHGCDYFYVNDENGETIV